MRNLGELFVLLIFLGQAEGDCNESSCRKKVPTNGGLRENYDIKFKNYQREGQASELILLRDFVVKRNGQFVTQTGTPLIISTRIVNGQFILELVQSRKGRKSSLGTARIQNRLKSNSHTVGLSIRNCKNGYCQIRVKLNGKEAKRHFNRRNYPFKLSEVTLSKINFVACKNLDRTPVTECLVKPRTVKRQAWRSLSETNCGRSFKITDDEMQSLPSFIRSTLKDGAVDQHLNECLYASEKLQRSREHVVGGVNAYPGLSPWTASIRSLMNEDYKTCEVNVGTATLIDKCWLLTAAHVISLGSRLSAFKVRVGDFFNRGSSSKGQTYNCDQKDEHLNAFFSRVESEHESAIEKFIRHPTADVALIKMKSCVEDYTKYIQPVCLPESLNEFSDDICGVVSGWGKSDPNQSPMEAPKILQISSIAHISEKQCKEEFDKQGTSINHKFQSGILFCAGTPNTSDNTRDTCSGDSGGPFVSYGYRDEDEFSEINEDYVRNDRAVLLGITSSGAENCDVYGFYSRVTSIMDWIYDVKINQNYN